METRHLPSPTETLALDTEELRENFLVKSLFGAGEIHLIYAHADRVIIGSAVPTNGPLELGAIEELRAASFCERRELGILNIGDAGTVDVDGTAYEMSELDCLYVGRGAAKIRFSSKNADAPARYYLISYPAHTTFPTTLVRKADASPVKLGSSETCNERTIFKCIHPDGVKSCQLVMGFTQLAAGSVWNTMPAHTHDRRTEVYLYFSMPDDARVFHFMGEPDETRHIVIGNNQAVISPAWSIHCGAGTGAYSFCWCMGGENQAFDDMDFIEIADLK